MVRSTRHARALGMAAAMVSVLVVLGASTIADAQGATTLIVRTINSTTPGATTVDFIYDGPESDAAAAKVKLNGTDLNLSKPGAKLDLADADAYVSIVIAPGANLGAKGAIEAARDALKKMVDAAPPGVAFGVTKADKTALRISEFTTDHERTKSAIDAVGTTSGGLALFDAIRLGASPFQNQSDVQANLLLVVGDPDSAAKAPEVSLSNARGAITGSGTAMFVAELNTFDPAPINQLVSETGGIVRTATDAQSMTTAIEGISNNILQQQYQLQFDAGLKKGEVGDFEITVGEKSFRASVVMGNDTRGVIRLTPKEVVGGGGLPLLDGSIGLVLVVVFTAVGATLLFYALTLLVVADDSLSNVLQPYADGYLNDEEDDEASALGRSALIQRAVELTEQVATSQGYLGRAEDALERANVPLRAAEALTAYVGAVVVITLLALLYYRSLIAGLVCGVLATLLPVMILNFVAKRRRKKFMQQLPDTLQLLSGTLRAGYSLMQGIEAVSQEVEDPMGLELRRVVTESRLGRPVEEALDSSAERMDSPDFAWAVMAIRIQREVGGNLSELLLTVAETMTARERLRREVAALTAEGRMSAIILGLLPPGLGMAMFVMNPEYTKVLFTDGLGIALLVISVISMIVGFLWMRKIINIEI